MDRWLEVDAPAQLPQPVPTLTAGLDRRNRPRQGPFRWFSPAGGGRIWLSTLAILTRHQPPPRGPGGCNRPLASDRGRVRGHRCRPLNRTLHHPVGTGLTAGQPGGRRPPFSNGTETMSGHPSARPSCGGCGYLIMVAWGLGWGGFGRAARVRFAARRAWKQAAGGEVFGD